MGGQESDLESFIYTDSAPAGPVSITTISYDGTRIDEETGV